MALDFSPRSRAGTTMPGMLPSPSSEPDSTVIEDLRAELSLLRSRVSDLEQRPASPGAPVVPPSALFDHSFFRRGFSLWGHLLATLAITLLMALALLLVVALGYALLDATAWVTPALRPPS